MGASMIKTSTMIAAALIAAAIGSLVAEAVAAPLPSTKYYQFNATGTCTDGAAFCLVKFPTIPADRILAVGAVDCQIYVGVTSGPLPLVNSVAISAPADISVPLMISQVAGLASGATQSRAYVARHEGDFYFGGGASPRISAQIVASAPHTASTTLFCSLAGRLVLP